LAYLPFVVLLGLFQNGLPNIVRKRLVSVGYVCQLTAYPSLYDFLVSVNPVIYTSAINLRIPRELP